MNPERLAEPRALAVVFTVLVLVAALLVFAVGSGATLPATDEASITRERPDRLPTMAEGEAAASACEEAGSWRLGECVISLLDNSGFDERLMAQGDWLLQNRSSEGVHRTPPPAFTRRLTDSGYGQPWRGAGLPRKSPLRSPFRAYERMSFLSKRRNAMPTSTANTPTL